MTTDRVYRSRLSHERAMAELERCAGTQFDPAVVAAFIGMIQRGGSVETIGLAESIPPRRNARLHQSESAPS